VAVLGSWTRPRYVLGLEVPVVVEFPGVSGYLDGVGQYRLQFDQSPGLRDVVGELAWGFPRMLEQGVIEDDLELSACLRRGTDGRVLAERLHTELRDDERLLTWGG
jgi:hypothetical protein